MLFIVHLLTSHQPLQRQINHLTFFFKKTSDTISEHFCCRLADVYLISRIQNSPICFACVWKLLKEKISIITTQIEIEKVAPWPYSFRGQLSLQARCATPVSKRSGYLQLYAAALPVKLSATPMFIMLTCSLYNNLFSLIVFLKLSQMHLSIQAFIWAVRNGFLVICRSLAWGLKQHVGVWLPTWREKVSHPSLPSLQHIITFIQERDGLPSRSPTLDMMNHLQFIFSAGHY